LASFLFLFSKHEVFLGLSGELHYLKREVEPPNQLLQWLLQLVRQIASLREEPDVAVYLRGGEKPLFAHL
jgi:hypothetical protein